MIQCFIGDNPKRAFARFSKAHSSYFPCEYCEACGKLLSVEDKSLKMKKNALQKQKSNVLNKIAIAQTNKDSIEVQSLTSVLSSINEAIKTLNRKNNNIVWPSSTQEGTIRTVENVKAVVERIEQQEELSLEESKGIMGRSLFLEIPYFNYVLDIPVEYLHGVCLGVVKKVVELTFNVGDNRQRNTSRKLSSSDQFNRLMIEVLVVREFSRRARNLDFSVMKGQEFRNIILFFFLIVLRCLEPQAKERRLWLLLAYSIRACILPNNEYEQIDPSILTYCGQQFYKLYEQLFHARNCAYYTHVISTHMPLIRTHGPLTLTSAFGFESFYGEMRNSFTPGTISPLKQIMTNILLKRNISSHCCKPSIYYSPKDTARESNSYIYTYQDNKYDFFKIMSVDDDSLNCCKVGKYKAAFPETPTLNWANVGVFKAGGVSDEMVEIEKKNVAGKVLRVQNHFLTCPINVLEEK